MVLKINLNMTNKWLYSFIIVGILLFLGTGAYAYISPLAIGHGGDTIWIKTPQGVETTLQSAIDAGAFACTVVTGEGLTGRIVRDIAFTYGSYGGSTCIITDKNITLCAGRNDYFQLGIGDSSHRAKFGLVGGGEGLKNVSKIIGNSLGFYALLTDGTVKFWGYNGYGQAGTGDTTNKNLPISVLDSTGVELTNVKSIDTKSHNYDFTCAVLNDGTVKCWGYNGYGQLGDGTTTQKTKATTVSGITNAIEVKVGGHSSGGFACAILNDGTVKCWGYNGYGQLGDGTTATRNSPVVVSGLTNVKSIYLSPDDYGSACAILNDGTVKCWGYNGYGQLGVGDTTDRHAPTQANIGGDSRATKLEIVGAGSYVTTCALLEDKTVKCWGYNGYGQLGDGTTTSKSTPTIASSLSNVKDISGSSWGSTGHFCAVLNDGKVKCWGYNGYGQLGVGDTTDRPTPTQAVGISNAIAIETGGQNSYERYTCAVLNTGKINCWGWNGYGGFGTGNTLSAILPAEVN